MLISGFDGLREQNTDSCRSSQVASGCKWSQGVELNQANSSFQAVLNFLLILIDGGGEARLELASGKCFMY